MVLLIIVEYGGISKLWIHMGDPEYFIRRIMLTIQNLFYSFHTGFILFPEFRISGYFHPNHIFVD